MNQVVVTGRITAKPKFIQTNGGTCYLNFFMRFAGFSKKAVDIQVTLVDDMALKLNNKLKEGYTVKVKGQLDRDTWHDKNGNHERMKIFAEKIKPACSPPKGATLIKDKTVLSMGLYDYGGMDKDL